jgi:hypothetical protein
MPIAMEARYHALIAQSVALRDRDLQVEPRQRAGAWLFQARVLQDRAERSASAVRERVRPALAIVRDEFPDDHGLHRMGENADRGVGQCRSRHRTKSLGPVR